MVAVLAIMYYHVTIINIVYVTFKIIIYIQAHLIFSTASMLK